MPKRKKKNLGGRPTKWKPEFMEQGKELVLSGFTHVKLAKFFKITTETLYQWIKENREFSDTLGKARDDYQTGKVEKSLHRRANGFRYTERIREPDESGKMVVVRETSRMALPETPAIIFVLKNRKGERWKDRTEVDVAPIGTPMARMVQAIQGLESLPAPKAKRKALSKPKT